MTASHRRWEFLCCQDEIYSLSRQTWCKLITRRGMHELEPRFQSRVVGVINLGRLGSYRVCRSIGTQTLPTRHSRCIFVSGRIGFGRIADWKLLTRFWLRHRRVFGSGATRRLESRRPECSAVGLLVAPWLCHTRSYLSVCVEKFLQRWSGIKTVFRSSAYYTDNLIWINCFNLPACLVSQLILNVLSSTL